MEKTGKILIADDEKTFLESTADLLRIQGCHCTCVSDAEKALQLLKTESFDLIVADIKMPGNHDLALVKEISQQSNHLSVILVTGYPNINTAIDAVNLSVDAYLIKPFACEELFGYVDKALAKGHEYREAQAMLLTKIRELDNSLQDFQLESRRTSRNSASPLNEFVTNNLLAITRSVIDLNKALNALSNPVNLSGDACLTLACQRPQRLIKAVQDAVCVLEKTKNSFKSKELAELRKNLEQVLELETLESL
ncbi:response regulator [Methylomarinum sp. Ch1-1]|uniref:Response regulator n=1 Tax=Methylomarinum roseum TaxID=3067653 RepID=A0AAU7NYF3_9GAMM|nr:response regulator [Methylomarinum sp. Ch1-1]MDP4521867.1 response regulator [Methylomarinum sp. Ch1-1]